MNSFYKTKVESIEAFFSKKEKLYPHNSKRMESEECVFFNLPKIGNLYYVNTVAIC